MNSKLRYDVTTALTLVIPREFHKQINMIRCEHDRAFPRWMPHINLIFPFVEEEHFDNIEEIVKKVIEDNHIAPFELELNKLEYFTPFNI